MQWLSQVAEAGRRAQTKAQQLENHLDPPKVASANSASSPEMQRLVRAFAGTWTTAESFAHSEF